MKIFFISLLALCIPAQAVLGEWQLTEKQQREIETLSHMPDQKMREQYTMIVYVNGTGGFRNFAYRSAMLNKMLEEANYYADKLRLPTKRPIQITDIQYPLIFDPWSAVIRAPLNLDSWPLSHGYWPETIFSNRIYDASIPREERLRSLRFGVHGTIETTNFFFSFENGKLWDVERLSEHLVEYYAENLDALVGKPSLIDTNGAYQLATQWLAAVDVDMTALKKLKWTVNQFHYKARGATNYITLPLYYVDFGDKHYPARNNLHAFDEPLISVEVLGTTKTLQELRLNDSSLSRRPLLLITNALDLIRTPNPSVKKLQNPAAAQAYALTPTEVSNYSKNFQPTSATNPPLEHLQRSNLTNSP